MAKPKQRQLGVGEHGPVHRRGGAQNQTATVPGDRPRILAAPYRSPAADTTQTTASAALTQDWIGDAGARSLVWETLGEPRLPAGVAAVVITHGTERERPAALAKLAPAGIPVVMSSQAWEDYRVPAAPYFVLVDGTILGEGVATSWSALGSLVGDAIADRREPATAPAAGVERQLAAAGIGADHPSPYPGRGSRGE